MAAKSDFTSQEWDKLLASPRIADNGLASQPLATADRENRATAATVTP